MQNVQCMQKKLAHSPEAKTFRGSDHNSIHQQHDSGGSALNFALKSRCDILMPPERTLNGQREFRFRRFNASPSGIGDLFPSRLHPWSLSPKIQLPQTVRPSSCSMRTDVASDQSRPQPLLNSNICQRPTPRLKLPRLCAHTARHVLAGNRPKQVPSAAVRFATTYTNSMDLMDKLR
jgi:hypothetical protein